MSCNQKLDKNSFMNEKKSIDDKSDSSSVNLLNEDISVPPPPFTDGIFPCMECHKDQVPNPERRKLEAMHDDIIFEHDAKNRWCLDCHDMNNRNFLKLASGTLVDFKESYRLCGQCHGPTYRDWKLGIHGKRTGLWNGKKEYLLCVHCHNPHSPHFKPIQPMPPPIHPDSIQVIDSTFKNQN